MALIARPQELDPAFERWSHWDEDTRTVYFEPKLEARVARVIEGTERTSDGRLVPVAGASLWKMTEPYPRSRSFRIGTYAGSDNP